MGQARIVLLGTGTGVPDADRGHTHLVWESGQEESGEGEIASLLVDVGGDTYRRLLAANVDPQRLGAVLLTHSHCDHITGLPDLLFSLWLAGRRERVLPVYGLAPTLAIAKRLVEATLLEKVAAPVEWREITAGDLLPLADGWALRTAPTKHSRPCVALRWDKAGEPSVAYSCDTEPCETVEDLARGAQTLIFEATTPGPFEGHTSPHQAGEVAVRTGAARLLLVHFSPRWTMPSEQAVREIQASGFTGQAEVGTDGQEIRFYAPEKRVDV